MILPPEITALVFRYLSPIDVLRSSISSRSWRERALDNNLWRLLYTREGWSADMAEVRTAESIEARRRLASSRQSSPRSIRRKPTSEPERNTTVKRARDTLHHDFVPPSPNIDGWREQHGTPEADEDMIMIEHPHLAQNHLVSPISQTEAATPSSSTSPSHVTPGLLSPPLCPNLFVDDPDSPRINWLYLYKQRRRLEDNWHNHRYVAFQLPHPDHPDEAHEECVYTIQYSGNWLLSGSRDKTIAIWDLDTQRRVRTLSGGHTGSVLCLQFDEHQAEDIVVSGGSDSLVVVWRFSTGHMIRKIVNAHKESVLNLRFDHRYLITCSKDHTIKIWNRREVFLDDPIVPAVARRQLELGGANLVAEYSLLVCLEGHKAAVNAIQVHQGQVVSASGDRTIRAWDINTGHCVRTYTGHTKGIACVQYDGRRIVSGSSDNTVRIFDAATSAEVARLTGHTALVRTVQARFGDMHDTDQDLEDAARAVDRAFHEAHNGRQAEHRHRGRGVGNAGSSKPDDVCALGAKIPPGGGGNKWSRIVSGSYDETVIIWRKDADGKWTAGKRLRQDDVLQPRFRRPRQHLPPLPAPASDGSRITLRQVRQAHEPAVADNGVVSLAPAHAATFARGQAPRMDSAQPQPSADTANLAAMGSPPTSLSAQSGVATNTAISRANQQIHPRLRPREEDSNRVFKLQFDNRRIISCSQNRIIVGWDFAAGDAELAEASRFFGETN